MRFLASLGMTTIFKNNFVFSEKTPIFALELESKLKEHRKTEKWDGDSQDCEVIIYCLTIKNKRYDKK